MAIYDIGSGLLPRHLFNFCVKINPLQGEICSFRAFWHLPQKCFVFEVGVRLAEELFVFKNLFGASLPGLIICKMWYFFFTTFQFGSRRNFVSPWGRNE